MGFRIQRAIVSDATNILGRFGQVSLDEVGVIVRQGAIIPSTDIYPELLNRSE